MVVLMQHAMTARTRLSWKQPCRAYSNKAAKRQKISKPTASSHEPATGASSTSTSSKQTPPGDSRASVPRTPVDAQSVESLAGQGQLTDHGSQVEESMPTSRPPLPTLRVPCQCSGMCAVGSPMCPARKSWSCKGNLIKGCCNNAVPCDPEAQRHYCLSCLCREPQCPNPRRRGLYCRKHAKPEGKRQDVFLGWERLD